MIYLSQTSIVLKSNKSCSVEKSIKMLKYVILCVVVIAGSWQVSAFSKEEYEKIHQAALPAMTECVKEYGVSEEAIAAAKKEHKIDGGVDPCFVACIFKKLEVMSDDKIDVGKLVEKSGEFLSKEEDIKKFSGLAEKCAAASEKGEGCEVATLFLNCLGEYREVFTPTD